MKPVIFLRQVLIINFKSEDNKIYATWRVHSEASTATEQ